MRTGHLAEGACSSSVVVMGPVSSLLMATPLRCAGGVLVSLSCTAGGEQRRPAGGAVAPVDDLGLVDDEPVVVGHVQARSGADRAVDVDGATAAAADEVVVVVVDPVLVAGRRPGRLDPADESLVGQRAQRVVDRLPGDRPDLGPHDPLDVVGG